MSPGLFEFVASGPGRRIQNEWRHGPTTAGSVVGSDVFDAFSLPYEDQGYFVTAGDLNNDGMTGITDFLALLAAWGSDRRDRRKQTRHAR